MSEMVERVVRAIMDAPTRNGKMADFIHDDEAVTIARAVLTEMREPTDGMVDAGFERLPGYPASYWEAMQSSTRYYWSAMIDAALSA